MDGAWVPALTLRAIGARCRLVLAGVTYGDGSTLQQAADDLLARLRDLALNSRYAALPVSTELPPPDLTLLSFLWELGERVERGEDIRERVFGVSSPPDIAL